MKLNLPMIRRLARRAVGRAAELQSLAVRSTTLHPEEEALVAPAVYLSGAVERIVGLSPWRSWDVEKPLISGGRFRLPATRSYLIEGVEVAGPCLYAGPAKAHAGYGQERWFLPSTTYERLSEANLVTTPSGSQFFGEYLCDDYCLELLDPASQRNLSLVTKEYKHDAGYRRLMNLKNPRGMGLGRIDRLTVYQDAPNNKDRAARYRRLRANLRQSVQRTTSPPAGVYLKRGRTGEARLVENEAEVEIALGNLGFVTVEPGVLDVDEIVRLTLDTPIVVSVEGSHLSHVTYSVADSSAFLVLQPPDRFALNYKEFTDCVGMKFGFVVGQRSPSGFTVSVDEMLEVLNRLMESQS